MTTDPLATAIHRREQAALANMPAALRPLPLDLIELKATNMVGLKALATLFETTSDGDPTMTEDSDVSVSDCSRASRVSTWGWGSGAGGEQCVGLR
ncbi:Arsenical pump-driving ATPase [Mycobacterium innocens]|uniref:Arsenical pump-driving ATPase n=1 Tax=Mycobacterium innocens TaxID=2341083 RepID=A0A498QI87_9MYCO|nr:Arsenical pump-driving ATPase [Mycobacterium innocens]